MKHQRNASIVTIVGLVLSSTVVVAAADRDMIEQRVQRELFVNDNDGATISHLRRQLPQQLLQEPKNNQSKSIESDATQEQHQRRRRRAKRTKKKKAKNNKRGGGGGGGSCTPEKQKQCCSKYRKPNFNMACKALGCKTTKCPRFNSEPIPSLNVNGEEDASSLAQQFLMHGSSSSEDEESLAQQFANGVGIVAMEAGALSSCESGCNNTQTYDSLISFTYQEGNVVENDCIMYRCREYPYSLWCTNELYVPGTDGGHIAWEMMGPC